MFPVSGKAVSLVCCLFNFFFYFLNGFSYCTGVYLISVLDFISICLSIYLSLKTIPFSSLGTRDHRPVNLPRGETCLSAEGMKVLLAAGEGGELEQFMALIF